MLPGNDRRRLKPRGGCKNNPRLKDPCCFSRHHDLSPGAGAECQETKSTCVAKLGQGLKSPFSGGTVGLGNQEGGENMQRMQAKRKTQGCAGTRPQHCGRKRVRSDTEEGEKLKGSQPDCPPPRRRRACRAETQKRTQPQLARGSGNLRSSSHRDRNSPGDGRSSRGELVHSLSPHTADSHPGWVGEQQPGQSSRQQRVLPPAPTHPEAAGSCQANEKETCRKRKQSCAEGGESAPQRRRRKTEASILVTQN